MSLEKIFDTLGHFGRFQACLYFAAVFQVTACGIHYLASVFLVETPNFVCSTNGNVTNILYGNITGSSLEEILPLFRSDSGPMVVRTAEGEQWELSRCRSALRIDPTDFIYDFSGNKTVTKCSGNFVYDRSEVHQNVVTEWDLVCDREWLAKLIQPTFMVGALVGALVFGDIADRVGRVKIMMATSFSQFVLGVAVAFSSNYWVFMVLRFLVAMVSSGYQVGVFVFITEFTGIKVRTWTSINFHTFFATGMLVVAVTGYLVRVWWVYQIILSLCTSPFLFCCWKFPETPFYLMAKGFYKETQTLLDKIARFNGLESTLRVEDLLDTEEVKSNKSQLQQKADESLLPEKKASILDMFSSWRMAVRTCTVWTIWFSGSLGFYVFSLGSVNLGGNQYFNLFLNGAVAIFSYLICILALERFGRKKTCALLLLLAGITCMLIIVVPDIKALTTALSMVVTFSVSTAFGLIYLYTCELYPTTIRSKAVGSGSVMSSLGSVLAPFCLYLADVWIHLPQVIVGILALIAGVLTFLLPETLGKPLTTTMEEAEALGRNPAKGTHTKETHL